MGKIWDWNQNDKTWTQILFYLVYCESLNIGTENDCQFGVSPVNYSDSDSDSDVHVMGNGIQCRAAQEDAQYKSKSVSLLGIYYYKNDT